MSRAFVAKLYLKAPVNKQQPEQPQPFKLQTYPAFSTFDSDGNAPPIPFLVDGLIPEGGLSTLSAKPKRGKSQFTHALAVALAKGLPFLGRDTTRCGTLFINLEDLRAHFDLHLEVLSYDAASDAVIESTDHIGPSLPETLKALRDYLTERPNVGLVVIDTLAKFIRVDDLNDYAKTQKPLAKLQELLCDFPKLHILGVVHSKKSETDDPFDSILGSTAIRGEARTNMVIYRDGAQHIFAAEGRMVRSLPPSLLRAEMVESGGVDFVERFNLETTVEDWKDGSREVIERETLAPYKKNIVQFILASEGGIAGQEIVLAEVRGNRQRKTEAIRELIVEGMISAGGCPRMLTLLENRPTHTESEVLQ